MSVVLMGVEIGATKQQIVIGRADGNIIDRVNENVALTEGAKSIQKWLIKNVNKFIEKYKGNISGACIGFGGPIQTSTGKILTSVQVEGWKDFELRKWFEETFGIKATVVNDTVAGGYAELICGAGRDSGTFFYSNIGSGIGGALFIDRKYYDGIGFGAAYLGNTYVSDWISDSAGAVTRLECLCAGPWIEKRLRSPGYVPSDSMLTRMCSTDVSTLDCKALETAAKQGDAFALGEIRRVARSYGTALANAITLMCPDTVVIGGGLAKIGELLINAIREFTEEYVFISAKQRYTIKQSELLDDAVTKGALLYACAGL